MLPAVSAHTACRTGFARCFRPSLMTDDRDGAVPTDRSPPPRPRPQAGDGGADDDTLWAYLRALTAARIGLKRSGASLATGPLLDFRLAHARARDAVHEELDEDRLRAELATLGRPVLSAASAVESREHFLMRPDLGRKLADTGALAAHAGEYDVAFVI